jgi:hypothetical protein
MAELQLTPAQADAREALAESDLPFAVDILERKDASDEFLACLDAQGMTPFLPRSICD